MTTLYPIQVDIKVHITDGQGQNGTATISGGMHRIPTDADMSECLKTATDSLPDGFRLMTRHESETMVIRETYPGAPVMAMMSLEDGEKWHDPDTANVPFFENDDDEWE